MRLGACGPYGLRSNHLRSATPPVWHGPGSPHSAALRGSSSCGPSARCVGLWLWPMAHTRGAHGTHERGAAQGHASAHRACAQRCAVAGEGLHATAHRCTATLEHGWHSGAYGHASMPLGGPAITGPMQGHHRAHHRAHAGPSQGPATTGPMQGCGSHKAGARGCTPGFVAGLTPSRGRGPGLRTGGTLLPLCPFDGSVCAFCVAIGCTTESFGSGARQSLVYHGAPSSLPLAAPGLRLMHASLRSLHFPALPSADVRASSHGMPCVLHLMVCNTAGEESPSFLLFRTLCCAFKSAHSAHAHIRTLTPAKTSSASKHTYSHTHTSTHTSTHAHGKSLKQDGHEELNRQRLHVQRGLHEGELQRGLACAERGLQPHACAHATHNPQVVCMWARAWACARACAG